MTHGKKRAVKDEWLAALLYFSLPSRFYGKEGYGF
jgi:hypothetical protein